MSVGLSFRVSLVTLSLLLGVSEQANSGSLKKEKNQKTHKIAAKKTKVAKAMPTPTPAPKKEGNLLIRKDGSGIGRVWSQPRGLECFEKCTEFEIGWDQPQVTVFAQADDNSQFIGWAGACVGTDNICDLTDANSGVRVVIAQFERKHAKTAAKNLEEPQGCGKKILDPVLKCGRNGDERTFKQQIDCWLKDCMGELDLFEQSAISVFDGKGNKIKGSVKLVTPTLVSFIAEQPLEDGETYRLKFKRTALKSSTKRSIRYENLSVDAGDLEFTFRGNGRAED